MWRKLWCEAHGGFLNLTTLKLVSFFKYQCLFIFKFRFDSLYPKTPNLYMPLKQVHCASNKAFVKNTEWCYYFRFFYLYCSLCWLVFFSLILLSKFIAEFWCAEVTYLLFKQNLVWMKWISSGCFTTPPSLFSPVSMTVNNKLYGHLYIERKKIHKCHFNREPMIQIYSMRVEAGTETNNNSSTIALAGENLVLALGCILWLHMFLELMLD